MAFDNLGGNGQAEAGAFDIFVFMFLEAVEPFGQALQIFSRNRYAGIGNADFNRFAFGHFIIFVFGNGGRFGGNDGYDAVGSGIFYGVVKQVLQYLGNLVLVGTYPGQAGKTGREGEALPFELDFEGTFNFADNGVDADFILRRRIDSQFDFGQRKQVSIKADI